MPYSFTLNATIPAPAQEIYEAWLDSLVHSEMTGGKASMSDEIDADHGDARRSGRRNFAYAGAQQRAGGSDELRTGGWQEHYFEPMKEYFVARKRGGVTAAAPNKKRKRVAAGAKSKRAAPKAKAAASKKRPKRAIAAKTQFKRAKKTKSKSTRGKRGSRGDT